MQSQPVTLQLKLHREKCAHEDLLNASVGVRFSIIDSDKPIHNKIDILQCRIIEKIGKGYKGDPRVQIMINKKDVFIENILCDKDHCLLAEQGMYYYYLNTEHIEEAECGMFQKNQDLFFYELLLDGNYKNLGSNRIDN